ncbi:MAG TPA: biopolymer transporter ExbD [Ohtaekwangia sp.]|uniref:ExbD/TolR family protein n=1 Tax=Ohtaekwangia sp. TaxID=2066019 RepID=UPI002F94275D
MAAIAQAPDGQSGKIRRSKSSLHMDMTPMVDLAFLLLTFFILTSTLMKAYVMPVTVPDKVEDPGKQPPIKAERVVTLILGENNKIYWYRGTDAQHMGVTNFSAKGVRALLQEKSEQIKGLYILIKPSVKSKYKNLVDILDEINILDMKYFALVTITPEEETLIKEWHP